ELLDEHRRLHDAIASGDADRARAHAVEHVRVNREVTLKALFPEDG
ncbi:MAG TPA: GntR family transcriptional regulator, partial [Amycolatopsis sp.]|nr:GntR family transcriptional regulator [Amycolatopsis sp.]